MAIEIKKIFFCFLILMAFHGSAFTQNVFVTPGSIWYYSLPDGITGNPFTDYCKYEYTRDTLVDGKTCRFIESSKGDNQIIYEENLKYFYYFNNSFELLYDFSVAQGDTIFLDMRVETFLILSNDNLQFIDTVIPVKSFVSKIDSIFVGAEYLKCIYVRVFPKGDFLMNAILPTGFVYFEKLGYQDWGFIPLLIRGNGPAVDINRRLRCFSDNETEYVYDWWAQFSKACDYKINDAINEVNSTQYFRVIQDKTDNYIGINLIPNIDMDATVDLIDLSGRLCYKSNFQYPSQRIYTNQLEKGLYILVVRDIKKNKTEKFKIIIQ